MPGEIRAAAPHREPPPEACKPDEGIEFVEPLPKEYECPLCLSVLKDPTLTNCGHHFCRAGIGQAKGPCPVCKEEGIQVFPDASVKRKINALQVRCNLKSHGCPWVGELVQLGPHLDVQKGDCDFVEVDCEFSDIGCTTKIQRKDVPQHREENVHKHLVLMVVSGSELEQVVQEQQAELIQKELQKKDEQIKLLQERVHELEVFVRPLPFEFTMTEFSKHKANNTEWFSPPFYSHPGGYKLCLAVLANGHDSNKGTRLSSTPCTMQGEYDDTLIWPRTMEVNIELFNHNAGKWENELGCNTGQRKKPTTPRESCNCWHNISHTDLAPYLKNDCLLFRISRVALE